MARIVDDEVDLRVAERLVEEAGESLPVALVDPVVGEEAVAEISHLLELLQSLERLAYVEGQKGLWLHRQHGEGRAAPSVDAELHHAATAMPVQLLEVEIPVVLVLHDREPLRRALHRPGVDELDPVDLVHDHAPASSRGPDLGRRHTKPSRPWGGRW